MSETTECYDILSKYRCNIHHRSQRVPFLYSHTTYSIVQTQHSVNERVKQWKSEVSTTNTVCVQVEEQCAHDFILPENSVRPWVIVHKIDIKPGIVYISFINVCIFILITFLISSKDLFNGPTGRFDIIFLYLIWLGVRSDGCIRWREIKKKQQTNKNYKLSFWMDLKRFDCDHRWYIN